ncbi:bifunctional riboflavin kinase/FAD synthetase [Roseibacillus ishigakijimensis]|uniref:Riboflavin biosynthesis protein n=1 Tax=Roseibacillus ishigakijimensis TaxID=454146 RepID=A0A934VLE9_9BACT|nr:bifunctional riboflavin kinase/FAD synthetase [Roseibacillus ishigakijimensis]MBK1832820.1 bifunctional riboflavin kinase/FAD synthetase [Roseibacillus ishigakijimensis]
MRRLRLEDLPSVEEPLALALGVFDGIHLGHQEVMARAKTQAGAAGGLAGVVTFEPHPVQVLAPERAPRRLLASLAHKERLLAELGLDLMVVVAFDEEFAAREAEDFLAQLAQAPRLRALAMGQDWRFGKERRGNVALLEKFGQEQGVAIEAVPAVMKAGERISSTRIRQALRDGNLAAAEEMLGRQYSILGTVSQGRQLGRTLGFPTANVVPQGEQLPPDGVWVVQTRTDGEAWRGGVANLGHRPTLEAEEERVLEVHLLDWQGDLYDQELEVRFLRQLRPEQKFTGLDALQKQIARDVAKARDYLAR